MTLRNEPANKTSDDKALSFHWPPMPKMASEDLEVSKGLFEIITSYFRNHDLPGDFEERMAACFTFRVLECAPDVDREIHIPEHIVRQMKGVVLPDAPKEYMKYERAVFDKLKADTRDDSTSLTQSRSFREAMDGFSARISTNEVMWMQMLPAAQSCRNASLVRTRVVRFVGLYSLCLARQGSHRVTLTANPAVRN